MPTSSNGRARVVVLEAVSKRYRLSRLGSRTIREELVRSAQRLWRRPSIADAAAADEFFALRDVSLEIERGEMIGLIGPNGSGKSTILKLLAHITYPSSGRLSVFGSVASLIEVGAGFHPELSGRDNIYLYGSIMGMRRSEVRQKFDRIVAFAELDQFIDLPVKRYSSGMYVRLGFAVAAHINPDVLLVDEVLAVGDAAFQSRCLQRIEALRRDGMTIVLVSHDMPTIRRLCGRAVFLHHGRIHSEGDPARVIGDYYNTVLSEQADLSRQASQPEAPRPSGWGRDAEIVTVLFLDRTGRETEQLATGDPLVAQIGYRVHRPIEAPIFELLFYSVDDRLHSHYSTLQGEPIPRLSGSGLVEISCDELGLGPGVYRVDASLIRRDSMQVYDHHPRRYLLRVGPGKPVRGLFHSPHRWTLRSGAVVTAEPAAPMGER